MAAPTRYRYARWDGSQEREGPTADELLEQISDDLLNFGDLQQALRNLMQRGIQQGPGQERSPGLRDLLQRLRQQRRENLERYDLGSAFDGIQEQLDEILDLERDELDARLDRLGPPPDPEHPQEQRGQDQRGQEQGAQPGDQQQEGGAPEGGDGLTDEERERLAEAMRQRLERKQQQIDDLPQDPAGQMRGLQPYEFESSEAEEKYEELLNQMRQSMMQQFMSQMSESLQQMTPEDMQRIKEMIRDLNEMLERGQGDDEAFREFMQKYGDMFGDNPPQSLEELLEQMAQQGAQMQNLLDSLSAEQRNQLGDMMQQLMQQSGLEDELARLAQNLQLQAPFNDMRNQYPFRGDEPMDLQAAMEMMRQMQQMDQVQQMLERAQYSGDLSQIDLDQVEQVLGPDARAALELMIGQMRQLEEAGLLQDGKLTPRGNRKIGEKALAEIYARLRKQQFGKHNLPETGRYGERADDVKEYEFGDPFHLDLTGTIGNALRRDGPQSPVAIDPADFQVYRSETMTQTATVVMLDLSWSMALRGSFQAAKKVAMALNNLIRMQYPRDSLYLVGFSAYAHELKPERLPYVRWDENQLGTNMHQGLLIAQRLLAKHKIGTRQIIMITDGEPTAHIEQGRSYFAYPPSPVTIRETLKEVRNCTRKDIVLNIFMLETSYYLKEFVSRVAKINQGRVFYTDPDRLGEYLLVDFVTHRRKSLSRA